MPKRKSSIRKYLPYIGLGIGGLVLANILYNKNSHQLSEEKIIQEIINKYGSYNDIAFKLIYPKILNTRTLREWIEYMVNYELPNVLSYFVKNAQHTKDSKEFSILYNYYSNSAVKLKKDIERYKEFLGQHAFGKRKFRRSRRSRRSRKRKFRKSRRSRKRKFRKSRRSRRRFS